uniref:Uncharacterized protein n=1 Tax=Anguilla anguilla TaxID=7936 RepID=A0A0E9PDQ0_ANGAN
MKMKNLITFIFTMPSKLLKNISEMQIRFF